MLVATLCVAWATNAQNLGDYRFSTGTDASKWITLTSNTNLLGTGNADGRASSLQNIGFTFPFGEGSYTQFSVNSDGNLRLGSTVTGTTRIPSMPMMTACWSWSSASAPSPQPPVIKGINGRCTSILTATLQQ